MYESAALKPRKRIADDRHLAELSAACGVYRGGKPDRSGLVIAPFLVAFQQPDPEKLSAYECGFNALTTPA